MYDLREESTVAFACCFFLGGAVVLVVHGLMEYEQLSSLSE